MQFGNSEYLNFSRSTPDPGIIMDSEDDIEHLLQRKLRSEGF